MAPGWQVWLSLTLVGKTGDKDFTGIHVHVVEEDAVHLDSIHREVVIVEEVYMVLEAVSLWIETVVPEGWEETVWNGVVPSWDKFGWKS